MKKKHGKHDSGRRNTRSVVFSILFVVLFLGFFLLLARLPEPWGARCAALVFCIAGMIPVSLDIRKTFKDKTANPHPKTIRRHRLLLAKAALCLYLAVVGLAWLFLDVPYKLFSVLNMLAAPAFLALYFLFPDSFTLMEQGGKTKHSLTVSLLFSALFLFIRTTRDFNILNWPRLLLLCLVPLLLLGILFFLLSKEWHTAKTPVFVFFIAMAMYLCGTLGQANAVFDRSRPSSQQGVLTDMYISRGYRSPDRYNLVILLDSGETMSLETDPDHYTTLTPGDGVTVRTCDGALNIPYAWAE